MNEDYGKLIWLDLVLSGGWLFLLFVSCPDTASVILIVLFVLFSVFYFLYGAYRVIRFLGLEGVSR